MEHLGRGATIIIREITRRSTIQWASVKDSKTPILQLAPPLNKPALPVSPVINNSKWVTNSKESLLIVTLFQSAITISKLDQIALVTGYKRRAITKSEKMAEIPIEDPSARLFGCREQLSPTSQERESSWAAPEKSFETQDPRQLQAKGRKFSQRQGIWMNMVFL